MTFLRRSYTGWNVATRHTEPLALFPSLALQYKAFSPLLAFLMCFRSLKWRSGSPPLQPSISRRKMGKQGMLGNSIPFLYLMCEFSANLHRIIINQYYRAPCNRQNLPRKTFHRTSTSEETRVSQPNHRPALQQHEKLLYGDINIIEKLVKGKRQRRNIYDIVEREEKVLAKNRKITWRNQDSRGTLMGSVGQLRLNDSRPE